MKVKKYYNTPWFKVHACKTKHAMLAGSVEGQNPNGTGGGGGNDRFPSTAKEGTYSGFEYWGEDDY